MKEGVCYKSDDGHIFESMTDCLIHEERIKFKEWYINDGRHGHKIFSIDGTVICSNLMYDWTIDNFDELFDIYRAHRAIKDQIDVNRCQCCM